MSVHRTAAAGSDCVDYVTAPPRPVTYVFGGLRPRFLPACPRSPSRSECGDASHRPTQAVVVAGRRGGPRRRAGGSADVATVVGVAGEAHPGGDDASGNQTRTLP